VFGYLAAVTAIVGIGAGILVRFIDHKDFATVGDGIWWAIVKLGSVVIVVGVTFVAFLTATVTSTFVSAGQDERSAEADSARASREADTRAMLQELLDRTAVIETGLEALSADRPES